MIRPIKKHSKFGIFLPFLGAFLVGVVGIYCLMKITAFFDKKTLKFNYPVSVKFRKPVEVVERKEKIVYIKEFINSLPKPETAIEKYICEKFKEECQIALWIAKSESGMREEAININNNGTIDMGIFQINSVHWKKEGCNPKSLLDAYKNTDCAYQIYQKSGWDAWVTYKLIKK